MIRALSRHMRFRRPVDEAPVRERALNAFARAVATACTREEAIAAGYNCVAALLADPGAQLRITDNPAGEERPGGLVLPLRSAGRDVGTLSIRAAALPDGATRDAISAAADVLALALDRSEPSDGAAGDAFHDALTSLPNRDLFADRLDVAWRSRAVNGTGLAVLYIDIDDFARVNESLGQAAGNELLGAVARRLTRCLRPADTAARIAGDEFAVLLVGVDDAAADEVARRILDALSRRYSIADRRVDVGVSIGVARHAESIDALTRRAEAAMRRAKANGKARVERQLPEPSPGSAQ